MTCDCSTAVPGTGPMTYNIPADPDVESVRVQPVVYGWLVTVETSDYKMTHYAFTDKKEMLEFITEEVA